MKEYSPCILHIDFSKIIHSQSSDIWQHAPHSQILKILTESSVGKAKNARNSHTFLETLWWYPAKFIQYTSPRVCLPENADKSVPWDAYKNVSGGVFPSCPNLEKLHMPVVGKPDKHNAVLQENISPRWKGVESCASPQTWAHRRTTKWSKSLKNAWSVYQHKVQNLRKPSLYCLEDAHVGGNPKGKAKSRLLLKRGWWLFLEAGWESDEATAQGG